ncbi:TRAP transporter small permease [Rhizobium sp. L1K21]|uniref:TRAP transporter small permease n=1 Tax=Rhizobium sp. L1K21 TaxID=2954933 RepID=UPI00209209AD|nr:TRAP transporter small permease [Rhizobium sp. L1K21]MCO6188558.1 TRAP transporter small permease [Rhizobium sp. L1K21]
MRWLSEILNRVTRGVDMVAGLSLAIVTTLIFLSAIGRYLFAFPIPESFDISRFLLGASVIWGFAVLGYSGKHITVDLLAETVGPKTRRVMDIFSQIVLLLFTIVLAWKMFDRLDTAFSKNEATFELRIQVWPFMALIWAGVVAAVFTTTARLLELITNTAAANQEDVPIYD